MFVRMLSRFIYSDRPREKKKSRKKDKVTMKKRTIEINDKYLNDSIKITHRSIENVIAKRM